MHWQVSTWPRVTLTRATEHAWTWQHLRAYLTTPRLFSPGDRENLRLPLWAPATFAGRQRSADTVLEVSCLVLDFDHGAHLAGVLERWGAWAHIVHTTWSHTVEAPRFRCVLPLARPVPAARWPACWAWAAQHDPAIDPACKDASRGYFPPALQRPDAPWWSGVHGAPRLLDLLELVPDASPTRDASRPSSRRVRPVATSPATAEQLELHRELRENPDARRAVGLRLGGGVYGDGPNERIRGVTCPACGRSSVWWWVAPQDFRGWRCNHRESCGAWGWLDQLEAAA